VNPTVTIYTVPKAFTGHIGVIQRNAIASWMRLRPTADIVLLGSDQGTAEVASEFGLRHLPNIKTNQFGTPLLNSIMEIAEANSSSEWLMLINTDIILISDFSKFAEKLEHLPKGLYIGLRSDLNVIAKIDMSDSRWEAELIARFKREGRFRGAGDDTFNGTDYYIYPRGLYKSVPPFAIGRYFWDSWLNAYIRCQDLPVVDVSAQLTAIHQNHDYLHVKSATSLDMNLFWMNPEAKRNFELMGGFDDLFGPREASHKLVGNELLSTGRSLEELRRFNRRHYFPIALRASWFFRLPKMPTLWNYMFPFDAATGRHAYARRGFIRWMVYEVFRPFWKMLPASLRGGAHIFVRKLRSVKRRLVHAPPAVPTAPAPVPAPAPIQSAGQTDWLAEIPAAAHPVCVWFRKHLSASSSKRTIAPAELRGKIPSIFGYGILVANKQWHSNDLHIHHVIIKREDISSISIEKLRMIYASFNLVYRDENYAILSRSNVPKHIECGEWPEIREGFLDMNLQTSSNVLAILNVWKRGPDQLRRQIHGLLDQTKPPSEIWVCAFGVPDADVYARLLGEFAGTRFQFFSSTKNLQTSGRYQLALSADTTYIAFIDDDIMIGRDFLRQSVIAIETLKDAGEVGIYGWRRLPGPGDKPVGPYAGAEPFEADDSRIVPSGELGEWAGHLPQDRSDMGPVEVDLLCGYHFLRTAHVKYFFREQPWTFVASDDIQLAFALRKFAGLKSYVLAIDPDDPDTWGLSTDWQSLGREQATSVGDMLAVRDMHFWRLLNRGHSFTWMREERSKGVHYHLAAFSNPDEAAILHEAMRQTVLLNKDLRMIALYCGTDRKNAAPSAAAFGLDVNDQRSHAWSWLDLELGLDAGGPGLDRTRATNAIYAIGTLVDALEPDAIWLVADRDIVLHSAVRVATMGREVEIIAAPCAAKAKRENR
jgi:hypothetical protein